MQAVGTALSVIFFVALSFIVWDWFMISLRDRRGLKYIEKNWDKLNPQDQQQLLELIQEKVENLNNVE